MISKNNATAELVGLSFGDGSLTYRKNTKKLRFQLRGDATEERKHYTEFIIPLFNKEIMRPLFYRNVGTVYDKKRKLFWHFCRK